MQVLDSYPEIDRLALDQLESDCGLKLPKDYREFLLRNNGGSPKHCDIQVNGEYFGDVSHFFGIRDYPSNADIRTHWEEYETLVPRDYLSIGSSFGGDLICISLKRAEFGAIYFWDHETASYSGEPCYDSMKILAPGIMEFLALLYTEH